MQQHKYTVERKAIIKRIYAKILFIESQTTDKTNQFY